jgi:ATP-binding cassette subfamily B protein
VKHLFYLNKYIVHYKWYFLLGVLFVVGSNYFRVLIPQAVRSSIDLVVELLSVYELVGETASASTLRSSIYESLLYYGLFVLGAALVTGIFMFFMRQTIIVMSRLIEYDLRDEIFKHYTKLDQSFLRKHKTGDLMSRISEDVSKVRMYLGPAILYAINLVVLFSLVIYTMFSVNAKLTLYTLLPLPVLSISIYYVSSIINKKSYVIQKQLAKLNSLAQEVYSGIRVVKSYVQEEPLTQYFDDESEDFKVKSLSLARVNALFFPLMLLLIGISTIITIYVGGLLVVRGEVSAGNIAEFVIYVNMLTWPVTAIGWIASIIQQAEASQERINEFLKYQPTIKSVPKESRSLRGRITFNDVSFTYKESGIKALEKVSFELMAGESMAIVGRIASGKTSVSDLLFRLFDADEGQVLIDGLDIRSYDLQDLRRQMAYVPQDVFLFSETVSNNIRFGRDTLSEDEIHKYAAMASIHNEIKTLPEGYETMVGERGVSLSGGQKQRISLARALVKEAKILVLDDSLSAVDAMTEHRIIDNLREVMKGRTTIFITHRLNALPHFDNVLVLDHGQVVEHGSHERLIEQKGFYYEMYLQQNQDS